MFCYIVFFNTFLKGVLYLTTKCTGVKTRLSVYSPFVYYSSYFESLILLNLQTLKSRRDIMTLRFAKQRLADGKLREYFPLRRKQHTMKTRNNEKYRVFKAHTQRYLNSPIISMQRLLNKPS